MRLTLHFLLLALPMLVAGQIHAQQDSVPVRRVAGNADGLIQEGRVEAIRQTALAAQVAGSVVDIPVRIGQRVKAGQTLIRLDNRAAQQGVVASASQTEAARAQLEVASRDLERQKALHQRQFVSQSAVDRAQAQWDAAQAQVKALDANTRAARAQNEFFIVTAPYDGVISDIPVKLGDMAMPGRVLLTIYDPSALRVTAAVPESLIAGLSGQEKQIRVDWPRPGGQPVPAPRSVEWLPAIDAATHTAELRVNLPERLEGLAPGAFARLWLPGAANPGAAERLYVPVTALVRRAELLGVYVAGSDGQVRLRQVRVGRQSGDEIEVLSGLRPDEHVLRQPLANPTSR